MQAVQLPYWEREGPALSLVVEGRRGGAVFAGWSCWLPTVTTERAAANNTLRCTLVIRKIGPLCLQSMRGPGQAG